MTAAQATAINEQLAEDFFEAIFTADRATLLRVMHPDVIWQVPQSAVPPFAGRHQGAEKIADMMLQSVSATFLPRTVRHRILMSMADERRVIAETNMTAQQANGREYNNFYIFIFECAEGRIREIREHVDTAYAIQFFGQNTAQ
jgi:ketosteroid isomerase-like protein